MRISKIHTHIEFTMIINISHPIHRKDDDEGGNRRYDLCISTCLCIQYPCRMSARKRKQTKCELFDVRIEIFGNWAHILEYWDHKGPQLGVIDHKLLILWVDPHKSQSA